MNNTQIIPVGQRRDYEYVDEPKEFAFFARSTEQRKREEAARMDFLKELFNGQSLSYEQLEAAAKAKGIQLVN